MLICLDAGHGMDTIGKQTPPYEDGTVIKEAEQNYPIMFQLEKELLRNGFSVILTNNDMYYDLSLEDRVFSANDAKADMFISLHKNATKEYEWNDVIGTEAHVLKFGGEAEKIAEYILSQLDDVIRGIKESNFYVLRETNMPAVLLELGFMTNYIEADDMLSVESHKRYASSICKGICKYTGKQYKPLETPSDVSDWAIEAREFVMETGISDGTRPQDVATREEIWTMLHRMHSM